MTVLMQKQEASKAAGDIGCLKNAEDHMTRRLLSAGGIKVLGAELMCCTTV